MSRKWAAGSHRNSARIQKLADGRIARSAKFRIHTSTEGFEYIIMVIVRGEVGKDVKAGGKQDPLQVLEARVRFPCSMALMALRDVPARAASSAWLSPVRWRAWTTRADASVGMRRPGPTYSSSSSTRSPT